MKAAGSSNDIGVGPSTSQTRATGSLCTIASAAVGCRPHLFCCLLYYATVQQLRRDDPSRPEVGWRVPDASRPDLRRMKQASMRVHSASPSPSPAASSYSGAPQIPPDSSAPLESKVRGSRAVGITQSERRGRVTGRASASASARARGGSVLSKLASGLGKA